MCVSVCDILERGHTEGSEGEAKTVRVLVITFFRGALSQMHTDHHDETKSSRMVTVIARLVAETTVLGAKET